VKAKLKILEVIMLIGNMTNEKIIKDAQYRKGLSIAFFNATNSAIALCQGTEVNENTLKKVCEIRDFFLEEHKTYYANVISNIGLYNVEESKKKISEAKNLEELKNIWRGLSEDERRDGEIIKVKDKLKKEYEEK